MASPLSWMARPPAAPAPRAPEHDFLVATAVNRHLLAAVRELAPKSGTASRPTAAKVLDRAWELSREGRRGRSTDPVLRDAEYYLLCRKNTAESGGGLAALGAAAFWAGAGVGHNALKALGLEALLRADADQPSSAASASSIAWCTRGARHGIADAGGSLATPRPLDPKKLEVLGATDPATLSSGGVLP